MKTPKASNNYYDFRIHTLGGAGPVVHRVCTRYPEEEARKIASSGFFREFDGAPGFVPAHMVSRVLWAASEDQETVMDLYAVELEP